jgi:hypothetical protein
MEILHTQALDPKLGGPLNRITAWAPLGCTSSITSGSRGRG